MLPPQTFDKTWLSLLFTELGENVTSTELWLLWRGKSKLGFIKNLNLVEDGPFILGACLRLGKNEDVIV